MENFEDKSNSESNLNSESTEELNLELNLELSTESNTGNEEVIEAVELSEAMELMDGIEFSVDVESEVSIIEEAVEAESSAVIEDLDFNQPELLSDTPSFQLDMSDFADEMDGVPITIDPLDVSDLLDVDEATEVTEFIEANQLSSIIESLLFSTDKPVSIATIKQIFKGSNIRTKDIVLALESLASTYAAADRGVALEDINGGYQLRTKSDNTEFLRRLAKSRPFRLSGPALEVLSIIAYKQPTSKHEVDEIRGVESGHLIRALMERSLVSFSGKSETLPGKPMTYGTTRKFLETFGLRNLKELPTLSEIEEILPQGIGEVEEKESLSDITDRMSNDITSSYSEGEDELLKINDQLKSIDTTSEFFEQEKIRERERRDRDRAQDIRELIVIGDAVDEKDRRWLDRYESKLLAQEQAAQSGTPTVGGGEDMVEEPGIGSDLMGLSDEAEESSQQLAESQAQDHEELDEVMDLTAHLDWSDDSEPELES
jgi:segregation and condensation protein B